MYTVYYTEYFDDFMQNNKTKTFSSLEQIKNWLFEYAGYYKGKLKLIIPDPEDKLRKTGQPDRIESNPLSPSKPIIWVHKIADEKGIHFSDGHLTCGQRHWNEEIKNFCKNMNKEKNNPTYNFV